MIENIRKYNGLIILGLVVVAVALVVGLQSSSVRSASGGQAYLKIDGRTYSDQEYRKLGLAALEAITTLAQSRDFQLFQFIYSLSPEAMAPNPDTEATEKFFIGRMLIRQAKRDFGVHPSDAEISEYTRNMPAFTGAEQKFDPEVYRRFIEKGIGRLGMNENDFRELVSDVIAAGKVSEIIGSGLLVNQAAVEHRYALANQQIDGALTRIDISPIKAEIKPTDEELKEYWELIQDAFMTEPQRRFTYLLVAADMPEEPASEEETTESIADAAMSDEAKAEAAKKKAEEKATKEAELAELRRTKQRELDAQVDDFTFALEEQNGEDFEKLAEEYGWKLASTELFTLSTPPAELNLALRSNSGGGTAASELFKIEPTTDPISKISQPVAVGESQWLVARLDEQIESRAKTFEEAKAEVTDRYIAEKANDALKAATEKAAEQIRAALAAGKDFTTAAQEAGLDAPSSFTDITSSYRPKPLTEPSNLFAAASTVDPGSLADPIIQPNSAFLVHVESREITPDDSREEQLERETDVASRQFAMAAFSDWLSAQTEASNVERYYRP